MQIRLLHLNDATSYREIRLEALLTHPEAFSSSYEEEKEYSIEKYMNRLKAETTFTFGAFENDQLIGVVTLVLETKNKIRHRANIVAMYVTPEKRRFGIGKNLMLEAINKAKNIEGIEQLYLTVTATNEPAKKLYHSLSFESYGIDKRALRVNETYFDDELMVLYF